jgi:hypothetical protein
MEHVPPVFNTALRLTGYTKPVLKKQNISLKDEDIVNTIGVNLEQHAKSLEGVKGQGAFDYVFDKHLKVTQYYQQAMKRFVSLFVDGYNVSFLNYGRFKIQDSEEVTSIMSPPSIHD